MKKTVIIITIIVSLLVLNKHMSNTKMIRFRIIANSNEEIDQMTKKEILQTISKDLLKEKDTYEEEKEYLINNIPLMTEKIKNKINMPFTINYGDNYFPEKEYNGTKYPEGMYESLVITLGEGKGDNFWCILFPPLCMIDEEENIEYSSFIKEVWNKIF